MINILKHRDENLVRLFRYFLPYRGKIVIASIFLIATALTSSATATLLGKLTDISFYQGGDWLIYALPAALIGVTRVCNFLWAARSRLIDVGGDSVTK